MEKEGRKYNFQPSASLGMSQDCRFLPNTNSNKNPVKDLKIRTRYYKGLKQKRRVQIQNSARSNSKIITLEELRGSRRNCWERNQVPRKPHLFYCPKHQEQRDARLGQSFLKAFELCCWHRPKSNTSPRDVWPPKSKYNQQALIWLNFHAVQNLSVSTDLLLVLLFYSLSLAEGQPHFLHDLLQVAQLLLFFCYEHLVLLFDAAILLFPGSFLLPAKHHAKEITTVINSNYHIQHPFTQLRTKQGGFQLHPIIIPRQIRSWMSKTNWSKTTSAQEP